MKILSYNIKDGGIDQDGDRLEQILEVCKQSNADIVCLMEAAGFHPVGKPDRSSRRFHTFARGLGMAGAVLETPSTHFLAMFARRDLEVLGAEPARGLFFHGALCVTLDAPRRPLLVIATHLHGFSSVARASEAECLAWYASHHSKDAGVVVCGDFNSFAAVDIKPGLATPYEPGWPERLRDTQGRLDTAAVAILERSGMVDCYRALHPTEPGITDPPPRYAKPNEPARRLDFVMASEELAERLVHCDVVTAPPADTASDHYPVLAEFDV